MIRKTFLMSVHRGQETEYTRRHHPIWQELTDTLRDHGVVNYSIHLNPATHQLFAYAEIESEERWQAIATTEVCQRWWRHMADLMPVNSDFSPIAQSLHEVFSL